MASDDVSESVNDLQHHLQSWKELGFDTSKLKIESEGQSPSVLQEIEENIQSALSLRQRMFPFQHISEVKKLLEDLKNPMDWKGIQDEFMRWAKSNAPWESNYFRMNPTWSSDEETQSQYGKIISTCAFLDESSWTSLDLLLPLLENVNNYSEIMMTLNELANDEERQKTLLKKAIIQLKEKGFDIHLSSMNLIEQFNEIERIQDYSNQIDLLLLSIQTSILPFDPVLADTFEKRTRELIGPPSDEIKTIQNNVKTISEHLQTRLQEMNDLIREWNSKGFSYEGRSQILAPELLEWEHLLPEVEQQYHRHAGAFERWKEITKLWDIQDASIESLAGKIEHTDAFLDKIEELEQQWTQKELQGASLIEQWEQFGFEMDVWRYKITQDPQQGLAELHQQLPVYERANTLLDKLLQLDTSLGGEEEVERRSIILRTMDLENDLLDEMQDWVEKRTVRNTRHRRMLQSEWEQAVRHGRADANKTFPDLYSFEEAIAALEHNHHLSSSISSHALERSKTELIRLEERGWNITELLDLHEHHPDSFFHQFTQAMETITRIASIQRRISGLDWRRDTKRADELASQVRNPLELVRIEQQIPALIRHLAERPVEDEGYTYLSWMPKQRPVLLPKEQSMIRMTPAKIQPESTLEEAHEAILEAMEADVENTDVEVTESIQGEPVESENDEEKDPQPTTETKRPEAKVLAQPAIDASTTDLSSYEELLRLLGRTSEADALSASGDFGAVRRSLASFVGHEPRDIRVDRMLRLVLRLLPQNDSSDIERSKIIDLIADVLPRYKQWVRMRLESRHLGSSGNFFEDAIQLGKALNRTPGPGVRVPLKADDLPLPEPSNLDELNLQTERLIQSMNLPAAGGIN